MTEQQPYQTVRQYAGFEVRQHPMHLPAEVTVAGGFEKAGSLGFRYLFGYISGQNAAGRKIAMTAPVVQDPAGQKIPMTAPVLQQGAGTGRENGGPSGYRVSFVLPDGFTLESAPRPTNPRVSLRSVPESLAAVVRFGGRWSAGSYGRHLQALEAAVLAAGLHPMGTSRFAGFDPPVHALVHAPQ